ncbi:MAG: acireductone synthase [Alcanivoracaceae bacterium]|nr:acireductone synthase [Alcanivoracaceae bacterium]
MPDAILTDIEGTTSSIRFVKDVLFPYAARHMRPFLDSHWETETVQAQVSAMAEITGSPVSSPDEADRILQQWIREDRKLTPLKTLQGMIWESGYRNGDYRAHIYPDAARVMRQWHASGMPLYVYSSGSIKAQELFFGHSEAGDIRPLFSGFFDTTSGAKQSPSSYEKIAAAIGLPPAGVLFLSDIEAELDAARAAGLQTCLLARPADSPVDPSDYHGPHPVAADFDGIRLSAT